MGIPKISNPFEDETDFIDRTDAKDIAKQAAHEAVKVANKEVVKPTTNQINTDQAIVDFLYGADAPVETDEASDPAAAGIEQMAYGSQQRAAQQAAAMQQIIDPDKQMTKAEKAQYTEEQLEEREKARLHQRNYFTMGNKLDDIGYLEEQVARVRQQKEQEEQERKQEEEEEEERKKQEEEEQKQQLAMPTGKKQGMPPQKKASQDEIMRRETNKAENKTGFSG